MNTVRRSSYILLFAVPVLSFAVVGVRSLRISGVYQTVGVIYFAAIAVATWTLGGSAIRAGGQSRRLLAFAGTFFVTPFALMALFWVGLGGPWQATVAENEMRYLTLVVMSAAVAGGFLILKVALGQAGEHVYASLGFAAVMLSGPLYVFWNIFALGAHFGEEHAREIPAAIVSLHDTLDFMLFAANFLTYAATAAFAASLGRVQWLGRRTSWAFITVASIALLLLLIRGLNYPDPQALSTPWYTTPGFLVGIPIVPYVMPYFFGVVLLRRAGDGQS